MKPFGESDLIAYHLKELSPRRARALEAAMQVDPSLAAESEAYATMLRSFKGSLSLAVDNDTLERNWNRLRQTLPPTPHQSPTTTRRRLVPMFAGLGFAFAATAVFFSMHHSTVLQPARGTRTGPVPLESHSGNSSSQHSMIHKLTSTRRGSSTPRVPLAALPSASLTTLLYQPPIHLSPAVPPSEDPLPELAYIPSARAPLPVLPEPLAPAVTTPDYVGLNPGSSAKPKRTHPSTHHTASTDLTLAMGGTLIGTRDVSRGGTTYSQGATHAVSAIASLHQQFRPALGYRIALSYTRPDFVYGYNSGGNLSGSQTDINGRIYELAGTYVLQGPHAGRVHTSLEGGAGFMTFVPTVDSSDASKNFRASGIFGAGAEIDVTKHVAISTSYRMQVFKGPDFHSSGTGVPAVATTLISNEPVVGITYRFSHK